jgi:hypothetical protein
MLTHPGLARAFPGARTVVVPPARWTCAGPGVIDAVERLRHAARGLAGPPVPP